MQVRAPSDELAHQLDVALRNDGVQCRPAVAVARVHVGAVVEHQPGDRVVGLRSGNQERAPAVGGTTVRVGPGGEQRLRHVGIARCRGEQDGP